MLDLHVPYWEEAKEAAWLSAKASWGALPLPTWEEVEETVWLSATESYRALPLPGDKIPLIEGIPKDLPWVGESVNYLAQQTWDIIVWIVEKVKKLLWEWLGSHRWEFIALVAIALLIWIVYRALSGCASRLFCE